jgi:hypothetical protein
MKVRSVEALHWMLQVVVEEKAQLPAVSQPVAPQGLVVLHAAEQQLPVPLIPQMPLEHCAFAVHGVPGDPGVPEVVETVVVVAELLVTELFVTDELEGAPPTVLELDASPTPPVPFGPPSAL